MAIVRSKGYPGAGGVLPVPLKSIPCPLLPRGEHVFPVDGCVSCKAADGCRPFKQYQFDCKQLPLLTDEVAESAAAVVRKGLRQKLRFG